MESWRKVWREGFAPQISTAGLQSLLKALETDDERLIQGAICSPPPLKSVAKWPVDAACGLGWCGWHGDGMQTVAEVEAYFAQACFECDNRIGEPGGCRWFLNFFDETPRPDMRRQFLPEVRRALAGREQKAGAA